MIVARRRLRMTGAEIAFCLAMALSTVSAVLARVELVNQITIGLLPARIRRMYRFSWDPVRSIAVDSGAEYIRRVLVPLLARRIVQLEQARAA